MLKHFETITDQMSYNFRYFFFAFQDLKIENIIMLSCMLFLCVGVIFMSKQI